MRPSDRRGCTRSPRRNSRLLPLRVLVSIRCFAGSGSFDATQCDDIWVAIPGRLAPSGSSWAARRRISSFEKSARSGCSRCSNAVATQTRSATLRWRSATDFTSYPFPDPRPRHRLYANYMLNQRHYVSCDINVMQEQPLIPSSELRSPRSNRKPCLALQSAD